MFRTIRTTYHAHKFEARRKLPCSKCGKPVPRTKTFEGYSNPFTKPPFMDREQMREYLKPEMDEWVSGMTLVRFGSTETQLETELCAKCRKGGAA